ncbi:hypothetical protein Ct9H90mP29_07980 [bacterium]|nr:MAG: hypothetical protein Ct9H90mP29_07980 [bacterium]
MFIGGMGGSTTGGMKVIRVLLLEKYAALELVDVTGEHCSPLKLENSLLKKM